MITSGNVKQHFQSNVRCFVRLSILHKHLNRVFLHLVFLKMTIMTNDFFYEIYCYYFWYFFNSHFIASKRSLRLWFCLRLQCFRGKFATSEASSLPAWSGSVRSYQFEVASRQFHSHRRFAEEASKRGKPLDSGFPYRLYPPPLNIRKLQKPSSTWAVRTPASFFFDIGSRFWTCY